MVPLDHAAIARVLGWASGEGRSVSLRHALIQRSPGLWGDHARQPRSVLLVRESDGPERSHAFGAGDAGPAVAWLTRRGRGFALLAPEAWEGALRRRASGVGRGVVETWTLSHAPPSPPAAPATRRLIADDARGFAEAAPSWALDGWGTFARLIASGAAFGVPTLGGGFAALAWVFEADDRRDAIGVATPERFRRLGLARAAASALIGQIRDGRRKEPIWTVAEENVPSKALARGLGFSPRARETLLRWSP